MFHDHLNPYVANEHARARIAEMERSIARRAAVEEARGARRRRRRWLAVWTVRPPVRLRPRQPTRP
jgi:hypothetical protein